MKKSHINILLFLIIIAAISLRFWDFTRRISVESDSSRDAIVSIESARQLQLPLTGSFSSIGPITFGPWYYWIITLANFIIPSSYAPWIMMSMVSIATVLVMYRIGVLLKDQKFGLILALIATFSPHQINSSTSLTQHSLIGFFSAVSIYIFLKVFGKYDHKKLFILWGFIAGVAINSHFQAVGLLILPFLFFLFTRKKHFVFPFLGGLLISMIPILFFELTNHWFNTRNIIDYILVGQYRIWTSNRWLTFAGKFIPEFWSYVVGSPLIVSYAIILGSMLLTLFELIQKKLPRTILFIFISFIAQVVMVRYYRGEKFFGYLQFFHPYIFLFTGYLFYELLKKFRGPIIWIIVVFLYLLLVAPNAVAALTPDPINKEVYPKLLTLKKLFPNKKFFTYKCKFGITDNIQALTLFLYMNNLFDDKGVKITLFPACDSPDGKNLENGIVSLDQLNADQIKNGGLQPLSPIIIYNGMARWWFTEQP